MNITVTRGQVLAYRWAAHQLDSPHPSDGAHQAADPGILDFGVQDTGQGGARWALRCRGAAWNPDQLVQAWTLRGAPHYYRRRNVAEVATATAPFSERDAAKKVFDAAKPLREAGIPILDALRATAREQRAIVADPAAKGAVSTALTRRMPPAYLRHCRPCAATHMFEMTFRLAALQAGLELEPDTSPPVLRRVPGMAPPYLAALAGDAPPRFHPVRNHLRFFGPTTVKATAEFLDATVADVKAHWPTDAVVVDIDDAPSREQRWILAEDADRLDGAAPARETLHLLATHDPYIQLRDRDLLVPDAARAKELWKILGRPGAVAVDGEVVGLWRPRTTGRGLTVRLWRWRRFPDRWVDALHHRVGEMAAQRGLASARVVDET